MIMKCCVLSVFGSFEPRCYLECLNAIGQLESINVGVDCESNSGPYHVL